MRHKHQEGLFFLETSTQIKRIFGHRLHIAKIVEIVGNGQCWSSLFVFSEFKRSLVSALIDFYFLLEEEDSPSEALRVLCETYKTRSLKFDIASFACVIEDEDFANNKTKCLIRLERIIEDAIEAFLMNINDGRNFVTNEIRCDLAKVSLKSREGLSAKENFKLFKEQIACTKEEKHCDSKSFWKKRAPYLKLLLHPENQKEFRGNVAYQSLIETFQNTLEDPETARGRNCQKLADTIIAIECPKKMTLLTLDTSFEALCEILAKKYVRIPSLSELRKTRDVG